MDSSNDVKTLTTKLYCGYRQSQLIMLLQTAKSFLRRWQLLRQSRFSSVLIKPKGSSVHSQKHVTVPILSHLHPAGTYDHISLRSNLIFSMHSSLQFKNSLLTLSDHNFEALLISLM